MKEEQIMKIEGVANFLRGMCLDPRLSQEFKSYILEQVKVLDEITETDYLTPVKGKE